MSDELRHAVASIRECAREVLVEAGRFDGALVSPFDGVATRDAWKPVQSALRTLQSKLLDTIYDAGRKDGRRMPLDMVPAKLWPRDLTSIREAILKLYELSPFVNGPASQFPHEMAKTICCQLEPLVKRLDGKTSPDGSADASGTRNNARDQYANKLAEDGVAWKTIASMTNSKGESRGWVELGSPQAARKAVKAYRERKRLDPLAKRKSGAPKKTRRKNTN